MMNNIEGMAGEMLAIDGNVSVHVERLERVKGELLGTMSRAQEMFGGQEEGQALVMALSEVLKSLVDADSSLYMLRSEINDYIRQVRK